MSVTHVYRHSTARTWLRVDAEGVSPEDVTVGLDPAALSAPAATEAGQGFVRARLDLDGATLTPGVYTAWVGVGADQAIPAGSVVVHAEAADLLADPATLAVRTGVGYAEASQAVTQAGEEFRAAVGWKVTADTYTLTLDTDGQGFVRLPLYPVLAVTSLLVLDRLWTPGVDYDWSADGFLRGRYRFPDGYRTATLVGVFGYTDTPADVRAAVLERAQTTMAADAAGLAPGLSSLAVGGVSMGWANGTATAPGVGSAWASAVTRYHRDLS